MSSKKIIAFNLAILTGKLEVCRASIRAGLSVKSMDGNVKKSPFEGVQLLLNFVDALRRSEEFTDEEIYCLIEGRNPESLSNLEMIGVAGMKQLLKEKTDRVKRFRKRPI